MLRSGLPHGSDTPFNILEGTVQHLIEADLLVSDDPDPHPSIFKGSIRVADKVPELFTVLNLSTHHSRNGKAVCGISRARAA